MTLLDLARLLRYNLKLIVVMTLLGLAAAAGYAYLQPVVYGSQATGIVVAGDASTVGGAMSGSALSQQRAATYVALANTSAVWARVVQYPEIQAQPEAAKGRLSGATVPGTNMLTITATGSSGDNARLLADSGLKALAEEALHLETLTPSETGAVVDPSVVSVRLAPYTPAFSAAEPISPDWTRILLMGAGLGLALGLVAAFLRKQLDVKVRTIADVEEQTRRGVLAVIPEHKEFARHREGTRISLGKLGGAGEALRQLRTNLRYVNVDDPPRVAVITSSNPGEGKSTIAALLAVLMARSGQPTVLIDADLRKPVQHKTFVADNAVGLSQVLVKDVTLEDALQPTNEPNLKVLTSGRVPANPSEMVGSRRMKALLDDLARDYFVIIDAPPILAVTDAGLLTAAADGAVLVTRLGQTRKEQLRLAVKLLEQVGGNVLGTVLHRAKKSSMGDVVYGAGYGGKYQSYYGDKYLAAKLDDSEGIAVEPEEQVVVKPARSAGPPPDAPAPSPAQPVRATE